MTIRREQLEAGYPDLSDVVDVAAIPFAPIHPGEILREEFLAPKGISAYRLAKDIAVPLTRITAILEGKRAITADTALRLSRYFRMSEGFWASLQAHYDIEVAKRALGDRLDTEVKALEAA